MTGRSTCGRRSRRSDKDPVRQFRQQRVLEDEAKAERGAFGGGSEKDGVGAVLRKALEIRQRVDPGDLETILGSIEIGESYVGLGDIAGEADRVGAPPGWRCGL